MPPGDERTESVEESAEVFGGEAAVSGSLGGFRVLGGCRRGVRERSQRERKPLSTRRSISLSPTHERAARANYPAARASKGGCGYESGAEPHGFFGGRPDPRSRSMIRRGG